MIALVTGALSLVTGPLAAASTSSRAVISMGKAPTSSASWLPEEQTLEGAFVYGPPIPASKGLPGFSDARSFTAEMNGRVVPTATGRKSTVGLARSLEGSFVYGARIPASKGLPGFSNPTSFTVE